MSTRACQLYLVMPAGQTGATARLAAVLAGGHVACVLFTPDAQGDFDPAHARPLIKLAQAKGVAALVLNDAVAAKSLGADGVHLADDPFEYDAARRLLGPKAIIGVDIGLSRHDAMELGERGAEYVAFNEMDTEGEEEESCVELVGWWAELFTVPCVAWDVVSPDEAGLLARSGADFVALAPEAWLQATDPGAAIDAFAGAIGVTGVAG